MWSKYSNNNEMWISFWLDEWFMVSKWMNIVSREGNCGHNDDDDDDDDEGDDNYD